LDDPALAGALRNFKASVEAWSDAAYSRPRTIAPAAAWHWRRVAAWAMGCVLAIGSLSGAVVYKIHSRQSREAKVTTPQPVGQQVLSQPAAVEQPAVVRSGEEKIPNATTSADKQEQSLLAAVNTDVSRQVPAAMEPLAQLMDDGGTKSDGSE